MTEFRTDCIEKKIKTQTQVQLLIILKPIVPEFRDSFGMVLSDIHFMTIELR